MVFGQPGTPGNLEPTPGWKGNEAAHYDPLPGDAPARPHRAHRGAVSRFLARLSPRRRRSSH